MKRKRQPFFTVSQAAKELGVTRAAIHRAIKQGRLEAGKGAFEVRRVVVTKMRGWRIRAADLEAYRVSAVHQAVGKK